MTDALVREAVGAAERATCLAIRTAVFVHEQGVPLDEEIDEHEATATHLLAFVGGRPVGTLRWRVMPPATAKIERVAVLREARNLGLGRLLMDEALRQIAAAGIDTAVLNAQTGAASFYLRLGFQFDGEPFDEAGIEHIRMRLQPIPGG